MVGRISIWRVRIAKLAAVGVIVGIILVWLIGNALTASTNRSVPSFGPEALDLSIASTDGIQLAASHWQAKQDSAPYVLLMHGNGSNRSDLAGLAKILNDDGFGVLAIDFRGHGESGEAGKGFGLTESEDAQAAFDWIKRNHPRSSIGVVGFSLGGAAALLGKQGPLEADAMVLECVYPDIRRAIFNRIEMQAGWLPANVIEPLLSFQSLPRFGVWPSGISPIRALSEVKAPVMIVGGRLDSHTPPAETEAMFEAARRNGEIWLLDGMNHDQVVGANTGPLRETLLAFLHRHLGKGRQFMPPGQAFRP